MKITNITRTAGCQLPAGFGMFSGRLRNVDVPVSQRHGVAPIWRQELVVRTADAVKPTYVAQAPVPLSLRARALT